LFSPLNTLLEAKKSIIKELIFRKNDKKIKKFKRFENKKKIIY
jgi:hypothetical protein